MLDHDVHPLRFHVDNRGSVAETFRESWGAPPVKQMVMTRSQQGTFRGMHYHRKQFDIWTFVEGEALIVLLDPRRGISKVYMTAGADSLIIPPGIAHGAYSLTPTTLIYGLTEEYSGSDEYGFDIRSYPSLLSQLPPIEHISERDSTLAMRYEDFAAEQVPV